MCMIDDDWSSAEFYRQSTHTARQPHRCGECYRVIQPGERYLVATGRQNGEFWTAKQCAHCMRAAELLTEHCRGFLFGGVQEDLEQHVDCGLPWSMAAARHVVGMRRQWRRFTSDALMPLTPRA